MGASGKAFLCESGHLHGWIEEDMYWNFDVVTDESGEPYMAKPQEKEGTLWELSERYEKEGCPCGMPNASKLEHYGDINDCRSPEERYFDVYGTDTFRRRVRIADAIDAHGSPIEAYREPERTLTVYRLLPKGEFPEYIRQKFMAQFGS